jgi:hypothetical protein
MGSPILVMEGTSMALLLGNRDGQWFRKVYNRLVPGTLTIQQYAMKARTILRIRTEDVRQQTDSRNIIPFRESKITIHCALCSPLAMTARTSARTRSAE